MKPTAQQKLAQVSFYVVVKSRQLAHEEIGRIIGCRGGESIGDIVQHGRRLKLGRDISFDSRTSYHEENDDIDLLPTSSLYEHEPFFTCAAPYDSP